MLRSERTSEVWAYPANDLGPLSGKRVPALGGRWSAGRSRALPDDSGLRPAARATSARTVPATGQSGAGRGAALPLRLTTTRSDLRARGQTEACSSARAGRWSGRPPLLPDVIFPGKTTAPIGRTGQNEAGHCLDRRSTYLLPYIRNLA
jgi:hypothetical protein